MTAVIGFLLTSKIGRGLGIIALLVAAYFGLKIWLAAHDAYIANAARQGYVELAEKTTAQARADELRRQMNAASQALTDAEKRRAADELADQATQVQNDLEMADYETKLAAANRRCLIDDDDLRFLQSH